MEETFDVLSGWLGGLGLAISSSKTQLMAFSRSNLNLENTRILVGGVFAILGGI